jgi:hypothetical protein
VSDVRNVNKQLFKNRRFQLIFEVSTFFPNKMTSPDLIMLKLGGSLITDKRAVEFVRQDNLEMLSVQIAEALREDPSLQGSSFLDNFFFHLSIVHDRKFEMI